MKEIIAAAILVVVISIAASYGLEAMDWSAAGKYTSSQVRL